MRVSKKVENRISVCAQSLGFKRKNRIYYRIQGEMLQLFEIEDLLCSECVVYFGLVPFAVGIQQVASGGFYLLNRSDIEHYRGWNYSIKDAESISNCVNEVCQGIETKLFPFFNKVKTSEQALSELFSLEVRQRRVHLNYRKESNANSVEKLILGIHYGDYYKLWFALDSHQYEVARLCYYNLIGQEVDAYQSIQESANKKLLAMRKESIICLANELNKLNAGDFTYFDNMIRKNKEISQRFIEAL